MAADEMSQAVRWTCGACGRINTVPDTVCVSCKTPDNYAVYRARPKYKGGGWTCSSCMCINGSLNLVCRRCGRPAHMSTPNPTTLALSMIRNEWLAQDVKKLCDDIRTQYKEGIVKVDDVLEFIRNWRG